MATAPQMNERLRARIQKGAEPLMEPGETVIYAVWNMTMPVWVYMAFVGIAVLPYVIQKSSIAVVTERNVYVFKTGITVKAKRILFQAPLGSAQAAIEGNAFPGRYLLIGDQKLWLHFRRVFQERAAAIAAAASNGPDALPSTVPELSGPEASESAAATVEPTPVD
jgi:hypothetical protein